MFFVSLNLWQWFVKKKTIIYQLSKRVYIYREINTYTNARVSFKLTLNIYLKFNDTLLCFVGYASLCMSLSFFFTVTPNEVIDIFTGSQRSAGRVQGA